VFDVDESMQTAGER